MLARTSLQRRADDRLNLLHTIGTLHLMELFVNKVEQISEQERSSIKLCPKTGKGIAKRMLVNIKNDTIKWMMSKMMVRRNLLPNIRNFNVLNMLRFSMWGPGIFPKEAFEDLRAKNPGKTNLDALLGITPKLPEDIRNANMEAGSKGPDPQNKKQKVTHYQPDKQGGSKRGR